MNKYDRKTLALKIAKAIYLNNGTISIEDIRAIPLLDNSEEAEMILQFLMNKYSSSVVQSEISTKLAT